MRNYKRKTQRCEVKEEHIEEALTQVRLNNLSVREASRKYGIAYGTLISRKKVAMTAMGREWDDPARPIRMGLKTQDKFSKHSSRQVFSCEEENQLADYLLTCSSGSYALTIDATQKFAYYHAACLDKNVPESWERDKKAGKDWARGFVKRHQISFTTVGAINEEFDLIIPSDSSELSIELNLEDNVDTNKDLDDDDSATGEIPQLNDFELSDEVDEVERPTIDNKPIQSPLHSSTQFIELRSSTPREEEEALDLTVRPRDKRYEVEMTRKRPQSMIAGPLDLTKPSISHRQLRFGKKKGRAEHDEIKEKQNTKRKIKKEKESEGESQEDRD